MLMQLTSITRVTFVEAVRQPIFVVLLLIGTLMMVLNPFMAAYSMEPGQGDNRMLVDLGLGTVFLVGVFLAAYILLLVFMFTLRHRVLQNKADPIDWPVMLFGVGAIVAALGVAGAANYLYNKVFTSAFTLWLLGTLTLGFAMVTVINKDWGFQSPLTDFLADDGRIAQVAVGGVFIVQGLLILTAFAVALSTRFSQVVTLVVCLGVAMPVGLMSGAMSQLVNNAVGIEAGAGLWTSITTVLDADLPAARKAMYLLAKAVYLVAPNFLFHWPADAINQGHSLTHDQEGNLSLGYLGTVTAYTALYSAAVLGLAVVLFQKREVS